MPSPDPNAEVYADLHYRIMNREWDPIGVFQDGGEWPEDEYQTYASKVYVMLKEGASVHENAAYLIWVRETHMGLGRDRRADREVAHSILELKKRLV